MYEFFMTNASPWTIHTLTLPLCKHLLCHATFAGIMNPLFTFIKTSTIPTYYGISIAILRYIDMQLSTVPFIMTRSIIVIMLFA